MNVETEKTRQNLFPYLLIGIFFGIVLAKTEVISWFRIQEMFRFQSFHMYGVIGSAVVVGMISLQLIKRLGLTDLAGNAISVSPKEMGSGRRYWIGGGIFGLGWALTGACPGPMFALVGSGIGVIAVALICAVLGTWTYGYLRPRLPH